MVQSILKDASGAIDVTPWAMPEAAPAAATAAYAVVNLRSIQEMQHPLTIFKEHGFGLGSIVKEKGQIGTPKILHDRWEW